MAAQRGHPAASAENPAPPAPAAPEGHPLPPPPTHPAGPEPFLRRLRRRAGGDPLEFGGGARTWLAAGVVALAALAILPIVAPAWSVLTERVATLLSLAFLMASVGLWLGMRGRAFVVAFAFVLSLYALTFWTRLAFPLQDFFVAAVLVSFALFALAGFNLVFVLEEVVHDAHVRVHVAGRAWAAVPAAFCMALVIGLPALDDAGGPALPALWIAATAGATLLLLWWFFTWARGIEGTAVLRELHVFVLGALAATALADGVSALGALERLPSLVPSLLAYAALLGTWVYVSYTTLQRTHFLLRADNWRPWVSILLGASFAILAHSQVLVAERGTAAVADLADLRLTWLVAGVWLGIAFYVARGFNRVFRFVRQTRGVGERGMRVAGAAERVAGGLMDSERYIQEAAAAMFHGIDHVLPGHGGDAEAPGDRTTGRTGPR